MQKITFAFLLFMASCGNVNTPKSSQSDTTHAVIAPPPEAPATYSDTIRLLERQSGETSYDHLGKLLTTIEFKAKNSEPTVAEEDYDPSLYIEKIKKEIHRLLDPNTVVIDAEKATLLVDYPLRHEARINLQSKRKRFTRKDLALAIGKVYQNIYAEEEKTASVKTIPVDERKGLYNRNKTNGKFGIWGHDLGDLVLVRAYVYQTIDGSIVVSLSIES